MKKPIRFNLTGKKYLPLVILVLPIALLLNVVVVLFLLLNPRSWKFDKEEASKLLDSELESFKEISYENALKYVEQDSAMNKSVTGESGEEYQIDIQLIWDSCKGGPIRVIGSVDDGRLRAFVPLSQSFIINSQDAREGNFFTM